MSIQENGSGKFLQGVKVGEKVAQVRNCTFEFVSFKNTKYSKAFRNPTTAKIINGKQ